MKKYIKGLNKAATDPTSLGNILVDAKVLAIEDLQKAIRFQQENQDIMLGEALVRLGMLSREILDALLLQQDVMRGKHSRKSIGELVEMAKKQTEAATEELHSVVAALVSAK